MADALTPQKTDYSRWYTDVIQRAELADYSSVKGCMVIRPNGYAIWEGLQQALDSRFKATGHVNAYFPLFIPKSFLAKEAEHVEGFAKECAIVTHTRLKAEGGTVVPDPASKLEEELIIRPTSETIIYSMYAKWVKSYRDLPILINQWANVVRWEMRTRLFLRTTEFLWQEGHTVHATEPEAEAEARKMLDVYADVAENEMALPVIRGVKSDAEKFAGALRTYCIEALMGDGKALQAGTSHHLGQNFTIPFDVKYQDKNNAWQHCWSTSWGVSTRLIGAIIMAHGDDQGLNLPPRLAPIQVVIIPIFKKDDEKAPVMAAAESLKKTLVTAGIRAHLDDRDEQPGYKYADWELRGIPMRLELGPKDLAKNSVMAVRRLKNDDGTRAKSFLPMEGIAAAVQAQLDEIQKMLFTRALAFRERMTVKVDELAAFNPRLDAEGGFLLAHWCGSAGCEAKVKEESKATIRVIPFDAQDEPGKCIACGGPSPRRAHFARAY